MPADPPAPAEAIPDVEGSATHAPAATVPPATAEPERPVGRTWSDGLALLRTTGRLLMAHWLPLAIIAGAGVAAHWYLQDLAIWLGRRGAVPSMLGLALVPFSTMLSVVGMLLVLRRRERSRHLAADLTAAMGSVLVPFLLVYQSTGRLDDDLRYHSYAGVTDDFARMDAADVDGTFRIPVATSVVVLSIVGAALLARVVVGRLVRRDGLWTDREDPRRMALRVFVGYCELVWITLGAFVVTYLLTSMRTWWDTRVVTRALRDWWAAVEVDLPSLGAFGAWLGEAVGTVVGGAVTALVVPVAWLAIGVIVYGIQATDVIDDGDVTRVGRSSRLLGRVTRVFGESTVTRAWRSLAEPDGRFGTLLGGGAMILKSGWSAVLVFCLAYVAITQLPYLVWGFVRSLAGGSSVLGWQALHDPVEVLAEIGVLMVSAALLAAAADALLHRFGAPSALRLHR